MHCVKSSDGRAESRTLQNTIFVLQQLRTQGLRRGSTCILHNSSSSLSAKQGCRCSRQWLRTFIPVALGDPTIGSRRLTLCKTALVPESIWASQHGRRNKAIVDGLCLIMNMADAGNHRPKHGKSIPSCHLLNTFFNTRHRFTCWGIITLYVEAYFWRPRSWQANPVQ